MAKVQFTHLGGRKSMMAENYAVILHKLGRGTYQTRDMQAVKPKPAQVDDDEPRVSEAVQEFAALHKVDLEQVIGTGKDGRIKKSDVEAVIAARE